MIADKCSNCRFFVQSTVTPALSDGQCRRYAPIETGYSDAWPAVTRTAWCGEHEPAKVHNLAKRELDKMTRGRSS